MSKGQSLTTEKLSKDSVLRSSHSIVTLKPKTHAHLYGQKGSLYKVVAINTASQLSAVVYGENNVGGDIFDGRTILAGNSTTSTPFEMNNEGYIGVWNWTDPKFSPKPEVSFALISLT